MVQETCAITLKEELETNCYLCVEFSTEKAKNDNKLQLIQLVIGAYLVFPISTWQHPQSVPKVIVVFLCSERFRPSALL